MNRRDLERHITDLAELFGWRHHHAPCPRQGPVDGFPTHALVREDRLVFITLAPASGRLSRRQAEWTRELSAATTIRTYTFRPQDAREVARVLRGQAQTESQGE